MHLPYLSILIWLPILTAGIVLLASEKTRICVLLANSCCVVSLLISYYMLQHYDFMISDFQLLEKL